MSTSFRKHAGKLCPLDFLSYKVSIYNKKAEQNFNKISNDAPKDNNPKGSPNQNPDTIIVKGKDKKDKQPTNLSSYSSSKNKELLKTELTLKKNAIKHYSNIDSKYYSIKNSLCKTNFLKLKYII